MTSTIYFKDFERYYYRAVNLQHRNLGSIFPKSYKCGDPLQDNVTIYDTVNRRYAGFSNMLEDLWYGSKAPKGPKPNFDGLKSVWSDYEWFYVFLVHRVTGSGASFSKDHGYRNTVLKELALYETVRGMEHHIADIDRPIFTSIGNQIPPFNKPTKTKYKTGGKEYLCDVAEDVVYELIDWFIGAKRPYTIKEGVDKVCQIQKSYGWKQFHFVFTAFIMDIAEYFPHHISPKSHCYYGKNAKECMDLLFEGKGNYDQKMEHLCQYFSAKPYDMEDVCCDYIRYVENYIPKGYEHLTLAQVTNTSLIPNHSKHASYVSKQREDFF